MGGPGCYQKCRRARFGLNLIEAAGPAQRRTPKKARFDEARDALFVHCLVGVYYVLLVRRAGWIAAAGLILGAVAASLLMLWTGENIGLGTYNHLLAASPDGVFFHASLGLGAKSALAFWPGLTSLIILLAEYGGRRPASEEGLLSVD